jgi:hypothetical protein
VDASTAVGLNLGFIGGMLMLVGLFGIISGKAFFPQPAESKAGPFLLRAKEPAKFWITTLCQSAAGLLLATRSYW